MTRRGFTVIELLIALTISAVLMTAFSGTLVSIWLLAREATGEMECALHACAVRHKLFHQLTDKDGVPLAARGLCNATDIACCEDGSKIVAGFEDGDPWSVDLANAEEVRYFGLDAEKRKASDYRRSASAARAADPPALQRLHLAIQGGGKTVYYDRLVVPIYGRWPDLAEFKEAVGVKEK